MIRFSFWWYTEISFAAIEKEAHDCAHVYVFLRVFLYLWLMLLFRTTDLALLPSQ